MYFPFAFSDVFFAFFQREKAAELPRQKVSNYDWVYNKPDVIFGKRSNLGSRGEQ